MTLLEKSKLKNELTFTLIDGVAVYDYLIVYAKKEVNGKKYVWCINRSVRGKHYISCSTIQGYKESETYKVYESEEKFNSAIKRIQRLTDEL